MFRSAFLVAIVVATVHAGKSGAQVSDSLKAALGAEIRLQTVAEPRWIRGTVMSVSSSAMTLQDAHGVRSINLADIAGADRFDGQPRWKGALLGLVLGAATGAVVGYATSRNSGKEFVGLGEFLGGTYGAMIGAPLGVVVGIIATPAQWQVLIPHR